MPAGSLSLVRKAKGRKLAKNTEKQVKEIVRKELDYRVMDNFYHGRILVNPIPPGPNGTAFQLTLMGQGDALGQRNGTGVMLKRLQMKVKLSNISTATPTDYVGRDVRFVVVRVYKDDPAFQPNFGLVFGNGTGATDALMYPKIQQRLGRQKEITVLYDRTVNLHPGLGDQKILYVDKKYAKPTGVYYDGAGRNSGQFWGIVIMSSGSLLNQPAMEASWKITYEDA